MNNKLNYNQDYFLNKYNSNSNGRKENKYDFISNVKKILKENDTDQVDKEDTLAYNTNLDNIACSTKYIKGIDDIRTRNITGNVKPKGTNNPFTIQNCAEKSTYCRPVADYYNQQFIFKTMSRNVRLQRLLKNIILSRQNEQQEHAWNQYIDDLKFKHGYNKRNHDVDTNENAQEEYQEVYDWYNTRYRWNQSRPCQNLLEDVYGTPQIHPQFRSDEPVFERRHYCYPICSQGRLLIMNRDKASNSLRRFQYNFRGNTIVVDKNINTSWLNKYKNGNMKRNKSTTIPNFINDEYKSVSVQVDLVVPYNKDKAISSDIPEIISTEYTNQNNTGQMSLINLESKLDELINIINKLMTEMKAKNISYNNRSTSVSFYNNDMNKSRSDQFGFTNTDSLIRGISSFSDVGTSKDLQTNHGSTRLNKILSEEIDKSNKIKKDIDDILNGRSHTSSLEMRDAPTKDMCTEIVAKSARVQGRKTKKSLATAMNTDPVGLLGLLKISKETIAQILSYMPRIDYNSYLSMVQFPQLSKIDESDYTCNICGAAFCRPSRLNEHIQKHNLDNTRNCCVCRHIVDSRRRSDLFTCRYCHQQFTRAYCCELHQRSCAKNFGLKHEESANLVMLS